MKLIAIFSYVSIYCFFIIGCTPLKEIDIWVNGFFEDLYNMTYIEPDELVILRSYIGIDGYKANHDENIFLYQRNYRLNNRENYKSICSNFSIGSREIWENLKEELKSENRYIEPWISWSLPTAASFISSTDFLGNIKELDVFIAIPHIRRSYYDEEIIINGKINNYYLVNLFKIKNFGHEIYYNASLIDKYISQKSHIDCDNFTVIHLEVK